MIWKAIQQSDGKVVVKKGEAIRLQIFEKLIWEGHARDEDEAYQKAKRECHLLDLETKNIMPEPPEQPRVPFVRKREN